MRLQTDTATWFFFGATTVLWAVSVFFIVSRQERSSLKWRAVPLSLFGFAWVAFAVVFLLRFLALVYDPALFRATRFPLWLLPAGQLARTWLCLGLYWLVFCAAAVAAVRLVGGRLSRVLGRLNLLDERANLQTLDLLAVSTAIAALLPFTIRLPIGLTTPVGHFSGLWVLPATIVWFLHFRGHQVGVRRFLYLMPGIAAFLFSPYREHLVTLFLCILLPLLVGKRRVGFTVTIALTFAILIASSVALYVYRPVRWEGEDLGVTRRYADWELWKEQPRQAPWSKLSARFHGFDSVALTLYLVPSLFPHQDRDLGMELVMSAFVPRALHGGKIHVQRGRQFSTSIWAYDEDGKGSRTVSAMIAPSMPGDLWVAGGLKMIALGALLWGVLIGLLECCRRSLRTGPAIAFVVLFGIRVAGGTERDLVHAVSTIVQMFIVLLLVLAVLPLRRTPAGGMAWPRH